MSVTNVLVADDSIAQRKLIAHFLQENEMEVIEACDGNEAVTLFQEKKPDVVILDLVMPNCGGKEALVQILSSAPKAHIIIVSSLGGEADVEECLRLGAASYIQKPYDFDDLLNALKSVS